MDKYLQGDFPPAAEMEKNGVDLNEMNSKLLKNIEEHTLYLIELKKDVDEMKGEMEEMRGKVGEVEKMRGRWRRD